jgi:outer membrane protein assembly factor BamB
MPDPASPPAAKIRPWPAVVIVALAAAAILIIRLEPEFLHGMKTVSSMAALGMAAAALLFWFVAFSGFSRQARVRGTIALVAMMIALVAAVRIDGFGGEMFPILAWRWTPTAEERFAARQAQEPRPDRPEADAVDLSAATGHDFPGYLGANRLGVVEHVRLDPDWQSHPPRELWRREVGLGWSSFAVVGEFAVTQEQRGDEEVVACYELRTGRPCWVHSDRARFSETLGGDGPRATPTLHQGRVYALGATGILNCLEGGTGKPLWSHNILEEHGATNIDWGMAGSPLVVDDLVIVCPGGPGGHSVVAYHAESGECAWHSGDDRASYVSPQLANIAGVRQVLTMSAQALESRDPASGKIVWQHPWAEAQSIKCAQPAVLSDFGYAAGEGQILVSSGYGIGSQLIEIAREGSDWNTRPLWQSKQLRSKFSNMLVREGHVFGLDEGILACVDLKTGKRRWKQGRYGYGQHLLVDDLLLIQAESGEVVLVAASTQEHRELARLPALSSKTWNPPVLAGRVLLVRNDREAACYELPGELEEPERPN